MNSPRRGASLMLLAMLAGGTAALGANPPVAAAPGQAGARVEPLALTHYAPTFRDWTLVSEVRILGLEVYTDDLVSVPVTDRVRVNAATMLFPICDSTASSNTRLPRITSELRIGPRILDSSPRMLTGYQSFARIAAWDMKDVSAPVVTLHVEVPMRCWETRIDEPRALAIPWSKQPLPPELALCLLPQVSVESASDEVQTLTKQWLAAAPRGDGPGGIARPYLLAKYLAGKVVDFLQPTDSCMVGTVRGMPQTSGPICLVGGFLMRGAREAAATGRGASFDLANLLTAVYRAAGIPCRLVVGVDALDSKAGENRPTVRAWTEFALIDDANSRVEWIPVDISRQREFSSRAQPIGQRWQYFGYNEELNHMCPIAYHWLPPTVCSNLGPLAFWGWVPSPEHVQGDQEIRLMVKGYAKRGDDPNDLGP